ncbi:hypothetical protein SCD92_19760, partial [Gilvimarinus sp. SDUM040013]
TPLYDEEGDWEGIRNFRRLRFEVAANNGNTSFLPRPDPYYAWHYRPEYQLNKGHPKIEETSSC